MNKYHKWYKNLVDRARKRITETYTETHHIVPRSLGGTDDHDNLVELTAREHFICHWLLVKMHSGSNRSKMINALYMMQGKNEFQKRYTTKITARVYELMRKEYATYISSLNKGRIQPIEEKIKQIAAQTGRKRAPFSKEWLEKIKLARQGERNGMYGKTQSDETCKKISDRIRGRKQTEEEKAKRSLANLGKVKPKKLCIHCNQMIAVNGYARWHGDNCRKKSNGR